MSEPTEHEMNTVGNALVVLRLVYFSPQEKQYLTRFLQNSAHNLQSDHLQRLFTHHDGVIDAIHTLNHFSKKYKGNTIMGEFEEELYDLLFDLHDPGGSITI